MTEEQMEGPTSSWGSKNRNHASTFMNMMMMITPKPSWTSWWWWWWWWYFLPNQSVKTNTLKAKDLNLNMTVRMWRVRDWNRAIHTFRLQRTNEWTRWTPPTRSDWPIYYRRSLAATSEKGPILWPSSSEGRLFDFCWWENIAQYI